MGLVYSLNNPEDFDTKNRDSFDLEYCDSDGLIPRLFSETIRESLSIHFLNAMGRQWTVEKWQGDPEGTNRGIVHPKDLDFSCDMIPLKDILPPNLDELIQISKKNEFPYVWMGSTRRNNMP